MAGCLKCDEGYIFNEELGIKVRCNCNFDNKMVKSIKPVYEIKNVHKELALELGIIPESRINDEYDRQFAEQRINEIAVKQNCEIINLESYLNTLDFILSSISVGNLRKSFIIGAPNSFSKTTFVYTCLKRLIAAGRKVTNYISLSELAEIRAEWERSLNNYKIRDEIEEEVSERASRKFRWKDYLESDVLFTYLTDLENKRVETRILKIILDIRGPKELPTIVMISGALKPYLNDLELKKFVWNDILSYNDDISSCDRLIHRSCFKSYKLDLNLIDFNFRQ